MTACRFDAVLIDFYGTISAGDRDAVAAACRRIVKTCKLPVAADDLAVIWGERFFGLVDRSNGEAFQTLYECEQVSLRETLAEFGVDTDPAPLVTELEAYWRNPPIQDDAAGFLEAVHCPVCCVSNADRAPLMTAVNGLRLRFDAVVTSQDARCYKPAAEIFREALTAVGATADRVVHIGDSLHSDIGGAAALGITTIWVCRENRIHDIGACRPTYKTADLAEALRIIDG